jgi:hypothetical protein
VASTEFFSVSLFAVSNDLYCFWLGNGSSYLQYRQYDAAPLVPQNLTVSGGTVTLNWSANTEPDIYCYEVSRKVGTSGQWDVIGSPTTNSFTDQDYSKHISGVVLYYRVRAEDIQNHFSDYSSLASCNALHLEKKPGSTMEFSTAVPAQNELRQNFPNPFNPTTKISYAVLEPSVVRLIVYDRLGREVQTLVNENKEAGFYEASFDGANLPSGLYFCKIQAGKFSAVKKMLLMK